MAVHVPVFGRIQGYFLFSRLSVAAGAFRIPRFPFLHQAACTECAPHEILRLQTFHELVTVHMHRLVTVSHLHVAEILGQVKRVAGLEVRHGMSVLVLEIAGLERYDAGYPCQQDIEFGFRVLLYRNLRPGVPYRAFIPFVLPHGQRAARCPECDLDRTGKVLHRRPIHLYEYLRGVLSGGNPEIGVKEQFLR